MDHAVDPGTFQICMSESASACLYYGYEWPKCKGMTDKILLEASSSVWSNVELVVYAGFLLLCMWTIVQ
eukprot:54847-Eustigmatos_ZCMA.PRE.1